MDTEESEEIIEAQKANVFQIENDGKPTIGSNVYHKKENKKMDNKFSPNL